MAQDRRPARSIDVTDGRFTDTDPVFTADGLYLGVHLPAQLRPGVRRADLRPVVPVRRPSLPGAAGRADPVAVRPAARWPSGWARIRPRRTRTRQTESAERTAVSVDAEGLPGRVVGVPVVEARYSGLRAVKGGLAWLREPVTGVLGEGGAEPERRRAAAGPGAVRPAQARGHRAGRRARLVRRQRRRHPAGGQGP